MARSVEHLVATHHLARQRRNAGQPIWEYRIDLSGVFHDESLTFEQRRDRIAAILRAHPWTRDDPDDLFHSWTLQELVDELAETTTPDELDEVWDCVYDEADIDRVWIRTV